MKRFTLAALAGAVLLSGCATDNNKAAGQEVADRGYTPVGTYIPRKGGSADNVKQVDKQQMENERQMGNAAINLPQR